MPRRTSNTALRILAFLALARWPCSACNVPVYQYALERWPADAYEAVIFHHGPLTGQAKAIVDKLDKASLPGGSHGNFEVRSVDLDAQPKAEMLALWKSLANAAPPWLALRYPLRSGIERAAWSAPLNAATADRLLSSPLRSQTARRILAGDVAVWVLLESGDKAKDDAAAALLKTALADMAKTLRGPDAFPADDYAADEPGGGSSKPTFSLLRLSRSDAAEAAFASMLLNSEDDLHTFNEPIAFPIFGRGRALYALVGKGINPNNIAEACAFLVGACSCQAKAMNPGTDLLMCVDWVGAIIEQQDKAPPAPPIMGVPGDAASTVPGLAASLTATAQPLRSVLWRNTGLALAAGFGIVLAAALVMVRRSRRR